jgi:hypothetical protein
MRVRARMCMAGSPGGEPPWREVPEAPNAAAHCTEGLGSARPARLPYFDWSTDGVWIEQAPPGVPAEYAQRTLVPVIPLERPWSTRRVLPPSLTCRELCHELSLSHGSQKSNTRSASGLPAQPQRALSLARRLQRCEQTGRPRRRARKTHKQTLARTNKQTNKQTNNRRALAPTRSTHAPTSGQSRAAPERRRRTEPNRARATPLRPRRPGRGPVCLFVSLFACLRGADRTYLRPKSCR